MSAGPGGPAEPLRGSYVRPGRPARSEGALAGSPAAVDEQRAAGHVRRRVGGEEHDRARNFIELAPASHWNAIDELLIRLGIAQQLFVHVGRERTGADGVAGDAGPRPLEREDPGQADDSRS